MIEENIYIIKREVEQAIADLQLDLSGLTILTEAASDIFVVTPLIALAAGAKKVYALSETFRYGKFDEIAENTFKIARKWGLDVSRLEIIPKKRFDHHQEVDLVTNLGHVRPLNKDILSLLPKRAVISYMCEAWEYRKSDLDLKACRKYGILVVGINEEYPLVDCFREAGIIVLKTIIETKTSLFNTKIGILSRDKFGQTIKETLQHFNKNIILISDFTKVYEKLKNLDLLIVADYLYEKTIVGEKGIIDPDKLRQLSPGVKIIQFYGQNNLEDIHNSGIAVYPDVPFQPSRMVQTFADVSHRAVIRLHAGGLKVGEIAFKRKMPHPKYRSLSQIIK